MVRVTARTTPLRSHYLLDDRCIILSHATMLSALQLTESLKNQPKQENAIMLPDANLTQFVKKLFADNDGILELNEIYEAAEDSFPLSDYQKEVTIHHEFRFHHEIRAILNQLVQNSEIIWIARGKYRKASNEQS